MNELEFSSQPEPERALATPATSDIDLLIAAWLDSKFSRSGSQRTRQEYATCLDNFRRGLRRAGLELDSPNTSQVATLAQAFASYSARGKQVAPATRNQRLAILSSFYVFALRRAGWRDNPIDVVERSSVQEYAGSAALPAEVIAARLAEIDRASLAGKRDYALLAVLLSTGRRLSEVAGLEMRDLEPAGGSLVLVFRRCKGGKVQRDALPAPARVALLAWIRACYGDGVQTGRQDDERPIWTVLVRGQHYGKRLGIQGIADVCKKRLGTSKVHATRHSFSHAMAAAGAPVAEIQARLGHASLATTGRYLASLKQAENPYSDKVVEMFGLK
jgi:site-specific recombinase XerD